MSNIDNTNNSDQKSDVQPHTILIMNILNFLKI